MTVPPLPDPLELRAGTLRASLKATVHHAMGSGALRPIETETHFVDETGVRFLVRVASNLARKDAELEKRVRQERDEGEPFNPFLPYEAAMFVASVSDTHVALLNKFNVIDHHLLIVTRQFVHQEESLDLADFRALDRCLAEYPSLGLYNGGVEAGASQPHKHLQLVPLPMAPRGPAVPIEPLLESAGASGKIISLPGLPFAHAFIALDPERDLRHPDSARLELDLYRHALEHLGIDGVRPSAPYNLLVKREWMLLVPRTVEHFGAVSINALGFAGSLFVRDEGQLRAVAEQGPLGVLRAVTRPGP